MTERKPPNGGPEMEHLPDNEKKKSHHVDENLFRRSQEFSQIFNQTRQFVEDLLKENERLRYQIALLQSRQPSAPMIERLQKEVEYLRKRVAELERENQFLEARYREIEAENKDFALRYAEIEEQNNNLANLYVASYQLHSTLDFQEVLRIVKEIIINLIGAEMFGIFLLDEKDNHLHLVAHEEMDEVVGMKVSLEAGILGRVARTGEPYYINQAVRPDAPIDYLHPLACIPLKIKERVIGVIAIYRLFIQKDSFSALDHELFSLLAGHAATAIFSARLYTQSERKLMTLQSFLELLTTPPPSK